MDDPFESLCSLGCLVVYSIRWSLSILCFIISSILVRKHIPRGNTNKLLILCLVLSQVSCLGSVIQIVLPRQRLFWTVSNSVNLSLFGISIYIPCIYFGYQLSILLDRAVSPYLLNLGILLPICMGSVTAFLFADDVLYHKFGQLPWFTLDPLPNGHLLQGYEFSLHTIIIQVIMILILSATQAWLFIQGTKILRNDTQRFGAIRIIIISFLFQGLMNIIAAILGIIGGDVPIETAGVLGDLTVFFSISMPALLKEYKSLDILLNSVLQKVLFVILDKGSHKPNQSPSYFPPAIQNQQLSLTVNEN